MDVSYYFFCKMLFKKSYEVLSSSLVGKSFSEALLMPNLVVSAKSLSFPGPQSLGGSWAGARRPDWKMKELVLELSRLLRCGSMLPGACLPPSCAAQAAVVCFRAPSSWPILAEPLPQVSQAPRVSPGLLCMHESNLRSARWLSQ